VCTAREGEGSERNRGRQRKGKRANFIPAGIFGGNQPAKGKEEKKTKKTKKKNSHANWIKKERRSPSERVAGKKRTGKEKINSKKKVTNSATIIGKFQIFRKELDVQALLRGRARSEKRTKERVEGQRNGKRKGGSKWHKGEQSVGWISTQLAVSGGGKTLGPKKKVARGKKGTKQKKKGDSRGKYLGSQKKKKV